MACPSGIGWLSILLIVLSFTSEIAQISAGIYYPSDALAGALIGGVLAITYERTILRSRLNFSVSKSGDGIEIGFSIAMAQEA